MNRDNLNLQNSNLFNNENTIFSYEYLVNNITKEYLTLNSIQMTSGLYNSYDNEKYKDLLNMKISLLLNEIKNVIEDPNHYLNFQLIYNKCNSLNQQGYQFEFFDNLKRCLLTKLNYYNSELDCDNEINLKTLNENKLNSNKNFKNNYDLKYINKTIVNDNEIYIKNNHQDDFVNKNYEFTKINNDLSKKLETEKNSKKFLLNFIEKYEEYKKICQKISETIISLDIQKYYNNLYKLKEEELGKNILKNNLKNTNENTDISQFNIIFKIIFSLFFENIIFTRILQNKILDCFFSCYKKIRRKYFNYITIDKEIEEYIYKLKNLKEGDTYSENTNTNNLFYSKFNDSCNDLKMEKNVSSNLKLQENFEPECEIENFAKEKHSIPFDNISETKNIFSNKKNDTILKIKGILKKKKINENKNLYSDESINNLNKNQIDINSNFKTEKKEKINFKLPLIDIMKNIFSILNDASELASFLNKDKLEEFILKFNERYQLETKLFYSEYCINYFENIKKIDLDLNKIPFSNKNKLNKNKKGKFSHYDISILNFKSDEENLIDNNREMKKNNNFIDLNNNCNLINKFNKNDEDDKLFINKKITKDNSFRKSGIYNKINYNTYCDKIDNLNLNEISVNFIPSDDSINNIDIEKEKLKLNNQNNIPISFEGFILEVTLLIKLENKLNLSYKQKNEIENTILEICLKNNVNMISENLKKFIDKSDCVIIRYLYQLFSKNEDYKNNFNNILNSNLNLILTDLEKNHIILNKFNRVEYVNFLFFVEEIFETKKKFYEILKNSLNNFSRSELIIKTSLEKVVNKNFNFMENFVKLIHDEIKIAIKNKNPYRLKDFQEKFLSIYKLFNEKDLFEIEYRKYLSKRLLRNSSMVRETEYDFFEILKKESGNNYTRKINKILEEISLSYDLNIEYSQKYERNIKKLSFSNIDSDALKNQIHNNKFFYDQKDENKNFNLSTNFNNINNKYTNTNASNKNIISNNQKNIEDKESTSFIFNSKINNNSKICANMITSLDIDNNNNRKVNLEINNLKNDAILNNINPTNFNNNSNLSRNNISDLLLNSNNTNKSINSSLFNNNANNCLIINNNSNYGAENVANNNDKKNLNSIENIYNLKEKNNDNKKFVNLRNHFIDLNVKVVSSDSWLLENINIKDNKRINISEIRNENFILPKVLNKYLKNFSEFYNNKFKNRQLKWINEYSYAYIDFKNKHGKMFNLITSNYQMSFLCLFNNKKLKEIKFREVLELLNIFDNNENIENQGSKNNKIDYIKFIQIFKTHLIPIFLCKLFLIKNKENQDVTDIEENDVIYLNKNFNQEDKKVKLLSSIIEKKEIVLTEEKKENEISHFVLEDRKHQLDSLIMKLLKHNKIIEFERLKALLYEEIKKYFIPEIKFIKMRLENLIDRNYIKRSESNADCYEYL